MPVPCQPCSAVPGARVKVILMGAVFLLSLAGSAGSYNPGRVPCRVWSHTALGSPCKKGKKGSHNAPSHWQGSVTGQWQCPTNVSEGKRPKAEGYRHAGKQHRTPPARTLLLQNAHCILLTTFTGLTLQTNGNKIFVTRSQKAWPIPHQNWWTCFHSSSGFIQPKFSHLRVRCLF